jgi:hypothetical protein
MSDKPKKFRLSVGPGAAVEPAQQQAKESARPGFDIDTISDSLSPEFHEEEGKKLRALVGEMRERERERERRTLASITPPIDYFAQQQRRETQRRIELAGLEERERIRVREEHEADKAKAQNAAPVEGDAYQAQSVPSGQVGAEEIDFTLLATRQQLIDAFGRFTGMDGSWFKNLKDTPSLLAARKYKGQGGRGHIDEPRFCPFEVMRWLSDERRKKGRRLGEPKAWELLEKHFPKVYGRFSIGDPRSTD